MKIGGDVVWIDSLIESPNLSDYQSCGDLAKVLSAVARGVAHDVGRISFHCPSSSSCPFSWLL